MSSSNLNSIKVCIEDDGSSTLNQSMYWGWRFVRAQLKYVLRMVVRPHLIKVCIEDGGTSVLISTDLSDMD